MSSRQKTYNDIKDIFGNDVAESILKWERVLRRIDKLLDKIKYLETSIFRGIIPKDISFDPPLTTIPKDKNLRKLVKQMIRNLVKDLCDRIVKLHLESLKFQKALKPLIGETWMEQLKKSYFSSNLSLTLVPLMLEDSLVSESELSEVLEKKLRCIHHRSGGIYEIEEGKAFCDVGRRRKNVDQESQNSSQSKRQKKSGGEPSSENAPFFNFNTESFSKNEMDGFGTRVDNEPPGNGWQEPLGESSSLNSQGFFMNEMDGRGAAAQNAPPGNGLAVSTEMEAPSDDAFESVKIILDNLSQCAVKTDEDADFAVNVVSILTKSLKEYNQKKGYSKISEAYKEAERKINTVKAVRVGLEMLSSFADNPDPDCASAIAMALLKTANVSDVDQGQNQTGAREQNNLFSQPNTSFHHPNNHMAIQNNHMAMQNNPMGMQNNPMVSQNNSMPRHNIPMGQRNNPIGNQNNPMSQQNNPMGQPKYRSGQQNNSMSQQNNHVGQINNPIGQRNNPMSQQNNRLAENNNHMGQQNNSLGQQNKSLGQQYNNLGQKNNPLGHQRKTWGQKIIP